MEARALVGGLLAVIAPGCGDPLCDWQFTCPAYKAPDAGPPPIDAPSGPAIRGTVRDVSSGALIPGATVTEYRLSDDSVVASKVTSDGNWVLLLPDGGQPGGVYVGAKATGYLDGYFFFNTGMQEGSPDIQMSTPADMATRYQQAGIAQDPAAGTIRTERLSEFSDGYAILWFYDEPVGMHASFTAVVSRPGLYGLVIDPRPLKVFANALSSTVCLEYVHE